MNKTLRQIIKNMFSSWIAVLAQAGIAFFLVPFLIVKLGAEGYGLIGLLGVLLGFSQIADLGLRSALGRELSEQVARNDTCRFNELLTTALVLYVGMACLLSLIGWMLAPWFVDVFKISQSLKAEAVVLIRLYGTGSIILSFLTPVFDAALSSHNRFDAVNTIKIYCGLFSGAFLFVLLSNIGNTLYGWVVVMLFSQLLMLVFSIILVRRLCNGVSIQIRYFCPQRLVSLFQLGGSMYVLQLTQALSAQSDPLVISYFFGPVGVALYRPGQRLSSVARPIVSALSNQLYPLTTQQHIDQKNDNMKKLLVVGTKFTLLLGVVAVVGMFSCAGPLCRLWLFDSLGNDYKTVSFVLMGWAAADFLAYAAGTQWPVLLGMKRLKFLIWTQVPTAILNILASIYLVGFTRLGIPGVLVATILIGLVRRPILIVHTARTCGIRTIDYLRDAYFRPLLILLILSCFSFVYRQLISLETWGTMVAFFMMIISTWLVLLLSFGLDDGERSLIWSEVMKYLHSLWSKK